MPRRRTLPSSNTKIRRYQRDGRASKRPCVCHVINRAVDLVSPVNDETRWAFRTIGCLSVASLEPGMPNTGRCTAAAALLPSPLRAFTEDSTICVPQSNASFERLGRATSCRSHRFATGALRKERAPIFPMPSCGQPAAIGRIGSYLPAPGAPGSSSFPAPKNAAPSEQNEPGCRNDGVRPCRTGKAAKCLKS
jgi:hypothetical protein